MVIRDAVELALMLVGTVMLLHANQRRRRGWQQCSTEPLSPWLLAVYSVRLPRSGSDRTLEIEGTVAQAVAGLVAFSIGIASLLVHV